MKKTKKFLAAALAAVTMASMSSMPASAMALGNVKIDYSIRNYVDYDDETNLSYEYSELAIDEKGRMLHTEVRKPTEVIVKMADGAELEADESRYRIEKLSKYQIKVIQDINNEFMACSPYKDIDLDINDDCYAVYFGINNNKNIRDTAKEAKLFCQELLESGKAVCAKPIINGASYGEALPISFDIEELYSSGLSKDLLEEIEKSEFYSLGLSNDLFGFKLTFANAEDAQSFEPESVEGFAENLHLSIIKDNVMYFQLKKEVQGKDMANVLRTLQNSEAVNNAGATLNFIESLVVNHDAVGSTIGGIPEDRPLGDADCNNVVDVCDLVNIAQYMLGKKELDEAQQILADYDCNGKVDILDGVAIAKYLLEKNRK